MFDIIIVGGGLIGTSLARALKDSGLRIALIEAKKPESYRFSTDDRGLCLAPSSQFILTALGVWQQMKNGLSPIHHIHVSCEHHFGTVRISAHEFSMDALGYVVIAKQLANTLWSSIQDVPRLTMYCPDTVTDINSHETEVQVSLKTGTKISGKLLVVADGSNSNCRTQLGIRTKEKHYGQTAIVANISTQKPHQYTAFERFTSSGPLALLPIDSLRSVLIYTVADKMLQQALKSTNDAFLALVEHHLGSRLGHLQTIGKRRSYPLRAICAEKTIAHRQVVIGNAAYTVHPNAAQGFNLALRDVAGLADFLIVARQTNKDLGDLNVLEAFQASRYADRRFIVNFSDGLGKIFYNTRPFFNIGRSLGLLTINNLPPLKRLIIRRLMGLYGPSPQLFHLNKQWI